ncbi:MAG: endonuclease/exonuclease/phosphatase family protein [Chthoniobacteraceae bacterium]
MRLISWNCKGAFHRKNHLVTALNPDVLIVPECEQMDALPAELGSRSASSFHWFGSDPRKGMAVMSFGDYALEPLPISDGPKWVIPLKVTGRESFLLFAVWTIPVIEIASYVLPLFQAHRLYREHWHESEVVWAGDFNANVLFDRPSRRYKFRDFIVELEADGIRSLYHEHFKNDHGAEARKTFYHYHHEERAHHIDYVFASGGVRQHGFSLTLGSFAEWARHSDHVPVVCDLFVDHAAVST